MSVCSTLGDLGKRYKRSQDADGLIRLARINIGICQKMAGHYDGGDLDWTSPRTRSLVSARGTFGMISGLYAVQQIKDLVEVSPREEHRAIAKSFEPFENAIRTLDQALTRD